MRSFVRALALCGALVASTSIPQTAAAGEFVPALRVQTGVTIARSPGNDSNDYFVAATPELGYFFGTERTAIGITYSFTGSLNSELPNGIANGLALTLAYDVAPTTRLLFGADALQSSIGNYLLVRRTAATRLGGVPPLSTQLLTLTGTQGLSHEVNQFLRLSETVTAAYVRSLDPDVELNNYLGSAVFGAERSWEFDALGAELTLQYAHTIFPPIDSRVATAAIGPTWDHDWSRTISTSTGISGAIAASPDPGTETRVTPAGRASVLYTSEGSGIQLSYAGGFEPNLLLGTLLQSHQATLRAFTPISDEYRILLAVGGGYLRAKTLDLATDGAFDNEFDAVLHDAEISWGAAEYLSIFARYQFIGQTSGDGPGSTPPLVRHGAIVGFELLAGRRPERTRIPTQFPQRVDRSDAPPPPKRR
jgi:hypothetical protein